MTAMSWRYDKVIWEVRVAPSKSSQIPGFVKLAWSLLNAAALAHRTHLNFSVADELPSLASLDVFLTFSITWLKGSPSLPSRSFLRSLGFFFCFVIASLA